MINELIILGYIYLREWLVVFLGNLRQALARREHRRFRRQVQMAKVHRASACTRPLESPVNRKNQPPQRFLPPQRPLARQIRVLGLPTMERISRGAFRPPQAQDPSSNHPSAPIAPALQLLKDQGYAETWVGPKHCESKFPIIYYDPANLEKFGTFKNKVSRVLAARSKITNVNYSLQSLNNFEWESTFLKCHFWPINSLHSFARGWLLFLSERNPFPRLWNYQPTELH